MNPIKVAIVAGIVMFGVIVWLASQGAVKAAECVNFDVTVAQGQAMGMMPFVIPADRLPAAVKQIESITGKDYGAVTRGFMVLMGTKDSDQPMIATFGFERDGCMLQAQVVPYAALLKKPGLSV